MDLAIQQVRRIIESTYIGRCTVIQRQKVKNENHSTGFVEVMLLEELPCKLSFGTLSATQSTDTAAKLVQVVKLFLASEISILPGSKLVVTQNGVTKAYEKSGEPALFATHQEILLEPFERWA